MPSAHYLPSSAIAASGREIDFPILGYITYDLRYHNRISYGEFVELTYWINQYRDGGAMPGDRKFRSPFSHERVLFRQLIDDFIDMWHLATNWEDLTDDEEENSGMVMTGEEEIDLYRAWPTDIGRFQLLPEIANFDEWLH